MSFAGRVRVESRLDSVSEGDVMDSKSSSDRSHSFSGNSSLGAFGIGSLVRYVLS